MSNPVRLLSGSRLSNKDSFDALLASVWRASLLYKPLYNFDFRK